MASKRLVKRVLTEADFGPAVKSYHVVHRISSEAAARLTELVQTKAPISSTSTILDVGAGAGAASLAVARRFPEAKILATDISNPMLGLLRAELETGQFPNVQTQLADAMTLGADVGSSAPFSHVFSTGMLPYVPDSARAVSEMVHAANKPGGLVAIGMWGSRIGPTEAMNAAAERMDPTWELPQAAFWQDRWKTSKDLEEAMARAGLTQLVSEQIVCNAALGTASAFANFLFEGENPIVATFIEAWRDKGNDLAAYRSAVEKYIDENFHGGSFVPIDVTLCVGLRL